MTATVLPGTASLGMSAIAKAIKALYGVATDLNAYLDKHIEEMKGSDKPTIARTGRVIDAAKAGFGIGYITPVAIIATGQLLLGNTFAAISTVATAATLTNPIAMTCAAVGAIYYGWGALSDVERNEILEKLSKGLEIGVELVKSIVRFVMDKTKELLSSENLKEIKVFVASAAATFGRTLGNITKKVADKAGDALNVVRKKSGKVADKAADIASDAYDSAKETAGKAADFASEAYDSAKETAGKAADLASETYDTVKETAGKASDSVRAKIRKTSSKNEPSNPT